jgi:hypothetical protein
MPAISGQIPPPRIRSSSADGRLPRRWCVGRRTRSGSPGFVVCAASRLLSLVADCPALVPHHFALMFGLERACLRRSHAGRRARGRTRGRALGSDPVGLADLRVRLSRKNDCRCDSEHLSRHAVTPECHKWDTLPSMDVLARFRGRRGPQETHRCVGSPDP